MRILLIEDDYRLLTSLQFQLEKEGISVDTCKDGEDGLYYAQQQAHDLILLDRMLPGIDGLSLLQQLRRKKIVTPVILLTALGQLNDKIEGLDAGADDYLVKPFAFGELMARIRSIARRPQAFESHSALTAADLSLDTVQKKLTGPNGCQELSKRETDLLELLMKSQNQTLSRSALLLRVWGPDSEVEEGNLDNYIHFLRRRLRAVESAMQIKTVRGLGYRLDLGGA